MGFSCRRPGCGREAEVCITYDAVACQVWLDPIAVSPAGGQPLCADHAQRLSAPRGWVILDRRTSQSTLMTAEGATPRSVPVPEVRSNPMSRRRLPRAWGQFDAPRLEFLADADVAAEVAAEVAVATLQSTVVIETEAPAEAPVAEERVVEAPSVEQSPIVEAEAVIEVDVEAEADPVVEVEPEPVVARASAPRRKRRTAESAEPLKKPKGRLLSRAFEASGPQRSAITEALGGDDVSER